MTLTSQQPTRPRTTVRGPVLCLIAATGFGLSVVFAREAGRAGTGVETMLAIRFALAAAALCAIVAWRRPALPTGRALLACAGLGLVGYSIESTLYFTSLTRIDGGLAALLLYTYPALVIVIAVTLGRTRMDRRSAAALLCSAAGLALLLGAGHLDGTDLADGIALALGAAGVYALYFTVADGLPAGLDLFAISAIVCTGAALTLTTWCTTTGKTDLPDQPAGWLWITLLALISTVIPIIATFAGIRAVGASTAAILSGAEPVVTAATTALIYGERLGPGQLLGGAAILTAVILLSSRQPPQPQATTPTRSHCEAGTASTTQSQPTPVPGCPQVP